MFVFPPLDILRTITETAAPGMPPAYWWVAAGVLGILALSATIDAFTEIVPDVFILLGLIGIFIAQTLYSSWESAAWHFRYALAAGFFIWAVNTLWYRHFRYDALGMGDAKWTMLAVACFGVTPCVYAWGVGAILASLYIGFARLLRYQVSQITFAPFLFIGLCAGLYWLRFAAYLSPLA